MKVAIYGGSFNPPHVGHVLGVVYALSVGQFERVLVMPVYEHALEKSLASFEHRVRLAELAMGWLPRVEVSRLEQTLPSPSYTLNTLRHLRSKHSDWRLHLIIGADVLGEVGRWHAFEEVTRIAPLFVLGRAGFQAEAEKHTGPVGPALPDVSSTEIRRWLERRDGAALAALSRSLPKAVLDYIEAESLYR